MVTLDRREKFADSESNPDTIAAESHALYESEAFRDDVIEALGPVFRQHLDCEAVDAAAEEVLREWVADDGLGALFQARNQTVSVREAGLDVGDIVRMDSARSDDDRTIVYVVRKADPDDVAVRTRRVRNTERIGDLSAGFVKYCDRFEVDRSERGRSPHAIVRELREQREQEDD